MRFRTDNYYCHSNAKKKKKTFSNEVCDRFVKDIVLLFNFILSLDRCASHLSKHVVPKRNKFS